MSEDDQWFAMRAYKHENEAESYLAERGATCFVARRWALLTYHGKPHRVKVPAIASLIFVKGDRPRLQQLKQEAPFTLQWIMDADRDKGPLTVPQWQMDSFMRVAAAMDSDLRYYGPGELSLGRGRRVRIIGGALDGVEGRLLHSLGKRSQRVYVAIDGVATVATEAVSAIMLQPLD